MKSTLLFIAVVFLISCPSKERKNLKYDVYTTVIDNYFSKKSPIKYDSLFIVLNDSISDFKEELGTLIYSVNNNDSFFVEYFRGDTSFKKFILSIKTIDIRVVPMEPDKIKPSHNYTITTRSKFKNPELPYNNIHLSDVIFNKEFNKAILFVTGGASGWWFFLSYNTGGWILEKSIISWVA